MRVRGMADPLEDLPPHARADWNYQRFNRAMKRHADKLMEKGFQKIEAVNRVMKGLPKKR